MDKDTIKRLLKWVGEAFVTGAVILLSGSILDKMSSGNHSSPDPDPEPENPEEGG